MSSAAIAAPYAVARIHHEGGIAVAIVSGDRVLPLTSEDLAGDDLNALLAEGQAGWDRIAILATRTEGWLARSEVRLTAPVTPRQVLQTGANYRAHVIELVAAGLTMDKTRTVEEARAFAAELMDRRKATGQPYFFIGLASCVVGDDVPLVLPGYSDVHDWELELGVVIGREAFRVRAEDALDHVAGYTIVNDVTTRDRVFREDMKEIGTDWFRSKNAPGFLPTGPYLVPSAFIDPGALSVRLDLNGQVMQDATTDDLLFDVPTLIAVASETTRLLPGDLLLTGSPAGNGQHWKRFLRDGDIMTGTIEGLGTQVVHCVAEESS